MPIAEYLEKTFPSPPIHVDSPFVTRVLDIFKQMGDLIKGSMAQITRFPNNAEEFPGILSHKSQKYFDETRTEWFGCRPEEYATKQMTEDNWKVAEEAMKSMGDLLKEMDGVFFEGENCEFIYPVLLLTFVCLNTMV